MRRTALFIVAILAVLLPMSLSAQSASKEKHYRYKYVGTKYELAGGRGFGEMTNKLSSAKFSSPIVLSHSADRKVVWLDCAKRELRFPGGNRDKDGWYEYSIYDGWLHEVLEGTMTADKEIILNVSADYRLVILAYGEAIPNNKERYYRRYDIYNYVSTTSAPKNVAREKYEQTEANIKARERKEAEIKSMRENAVGKPFPMAEFTDENGNKVDALLFKRGDKTLVVTHIQGCGPSTNLLKYVEDIDWNVIVINLGDKPKRHTLPNATHIYLKSSYDWCFGRSAPYYILLDGNGDVLEWHKGFSTNQTQAIDAIKSAIVGDNGQFKEQPKDEIWYSTTDGNKITIKSNSFGAAKVISHTYRGSRGIIKFDRELALIQYYAFSDCKSLRRIAIPDGVATIEANVFANCANLTTVKLGNSVREVGYNTFGGCKMLSHITLPEGLTAIRGCAFYNCSSLSNITIPESVSVIGDSAFMNCTSLTSMRLPKRVTRIESSTFEGCSALKDVSAWGVTSIGSSAFKGCKKLRDIHYSYNLTTIESSAFEGCSSVTDFKDFGLITSIGYAAFSGCTGLTEVVIPKSVTSIGGSAFFNCRNLKRVIIIGENVTSIGSYAFRYCDKLTDVVIPDKVSGIASFAFADCSSLKSVTLPKNLTSIGYAAFYKCRNLESIEIPAGVTRIEGFAFADCDKLKTVVVPDGVESIGEQAFSACDNIREITIPKSVTSIGSKAFYCCGGKLVIDSKILETDCEEKTIPSDNKESWLNSSSFSTITIGGNVKKIGAYTFAKYRYLYNLTLPEGLVEIGDSAFWRCSVKDLTIPKSVTSIGENAFVGASGTLTINSKIVEADCADDTAPKSRWLADTKFKKIILGDGITKIGARTFQDYTSVTAITIPNGVTTIGERAFASANLVDLTLPSSVTSIGDCAFLHNVNLSSVTIEATTPPQLGADVFSECYSKCFVYVPDSSIKAYKKSWKKRLSAGVKLVKQSKKRTFN